MSRKMDWTALANGYPEIADALDAIPECKGWETMGWTKLARLLAKIGHPDLADRILDVTDAHGQKWDAERERVKRAARM